MKNSIAKDIMNTEILTVPNDLPVSELALFFTEHEISGAPVLDGEGHLIGVVSLTDIARTEIDRVGTERSDSAYFTMGSETPSKLSNLSGLAIRESDSIVVNDILTPAVYSVPEETPIQEIARTMISGRIHRVLVTHNGQVTGIITSLDMLKLLCD